MQKEVFDFFDHHIDTKRPVLLGLSGGPDSTCLLHLYLLWNKARDKPPLHLVHVNHGWRCESIDELQTLRNSPKS